MFRLGFGKRIPRPNFAGRWWEVQSHWLRRRTRFYHPMRSLGKRSLIWEGLSGLCFKNFYVVRVRVRYLSLEWGSFRSCFWRGRRASCAWGCFVNLSIWVELNWLEIFEKSHSRYRSIESLEQSNLFSMNQNMQFLASLWGIDLNFFHLAFSFSWIFHL